MIPATKNIHTRKNTIPKLTRSRFKGKPTKLDYLTGLEFKAGDPYFSWRPKNGKGFIAYSRYRPTIEELMTPFNPDRFQSLDKAE